jgi:uncharacterized ion transporter superfamily protein YfcC
MNGDKIAGSFVEGCHKFVYAAVVISLTRGILIVADDGLLIDTVVHGLARLLQGVLRVLRAPLMLLAHMPITLFVPPTSAEAAPTMPIMGRSAAWAA